ncbi:hypothetical protein HHI36_020577 [Cryptolaemus montrouzieri]|uniref:C2H2-type domain-containing protein n=1 Tax=Cryptolaemus montrouzieri TaxID=559131 RepID=A0ABD2NAM2_9CUCU
MSKKKGRKPNKRVEVDPKLRSDLDLQCFQCLEIFASKAEVVRHHKVTNHIMAPNYKCGICSKAISKRKAYWDHMAMHRHLKKKAVCEVCGAVVVSLHLKRHMLVHQEKTHVCQYCGKGYVQKNTLTDHVKRKHEGDEKDLNTLCFICGEICSDLKGLTTHLNTHTDDKLKGLSHHCEICGKYFLNAQSLSTHVYMAHKITERLPKQHKRSKTVRQKPKRLPREKNEDSDNTKESKPKRGKTESKKDTVKREPRECPTCHKMICYLGYSRHLTTHTGVKPHQCKQCPKSFRLFTSLKSHMYVHLDLKPFKCDICSQQFRHYTTLKVHKRVHTGEKPYKCLVCTKGFRSASGLKRHQNQRLHHKSKLGEDQNEVDALKNVENND